MRKTQIYFALLAVSIVASLFIGASNTTPVLADDNNRETHRQAGFRPQPPVVAIRDDCQPNADWGPGGCLLREGDVTRAEFFAEAESPLAPTSVIGHQAWWNDPPYLKVASGRSVKVRNEGGRTHTFTEVEHFGAGRPRPPATEVLNKGLLTAPECLTSTDILPGASIELTDLGPGNHRFQCCIHSWMRAMIKVTPKDKDDDEKEEN